MNVNEVAITNLLDSIKNHNQESLEFHTMVLKHNKASDDLKSAKAALKSAKAAFAKTFGFKGTPLVVRVPNSNQVIRVTRALFGHDEIDISVEEIIE